MTSGRGHGYVTHVYYPGVPRLDEFTVRANDTISYTAFAPTETERINDSTWYVVGLKYNMFVIESHTEPGVSASIVWSSAERDSLRQVHDIIYSVGVGIGPKTLMRGDRVGISWSENESKMLDVLLAIYRDERLRTRIAFKTINRTNL